MILALLAGAIVGLILDRLDVPGGLILGSMLGAAAVTVVRQIEAPSLPGPVITIVYIVLGSSIGMTVTRDVLGELQTVAAGAVLSAAVFIVFGIVVAYGLKAVGLAPGGVVLATSPGALSVMSAAGAELGVGAQVAVFHTVRVVMVMLSLPLLLRIAGS